MATGEATIHVDAPPERIYDLISDVTRMGEWSPECHTCVWQDGATGPAIGARFKGSNKRGMIRWTTTAKVMAAAPGREFAFTVVSGDRELTRWRYELAPAGEGTDVTESYELVHEPLYVRMFEKVFWRDRPDQLVEGMRATLERVKTVAERSAST